MRTGERRRGTAKYSERGGCCARRGDRWSPAGSETIEALSEKRQRRPFGRLRNAHLRAELLDLDRGARLFELRLDLVGLLLGHALLDGVRRAVDEVLGLLQAQARDRPDDLDHLDLLVARTGE